MPNHEDTELALAALHRCTQNLRAGRIDAASAAVRLHGVRAAKANELAEMLADALAFCERLTFITEADVRYEQQKDTDG